MKCLNLIIFSLLAANLFETKNKSNTKYDRLYNECKNTGCKNRQQDEDCIFRCISTSCYHKIFSEYILEYGEANYEFKSLIQNRVNFSK